MAATIVQFGGDRWQRKKVVDGGQRSIGQEFGLRLGLFERDLLEGRLRGWDGMGRYLCGAGHSS